jgi:hypothetical protein
MMTAEDQAVVENMKSDLEQVLLQLNPREAGVVRLRFGLKDGHERTLEEVGAVFGVSSSQRWGGLGVAGARVRVGQGMVLWGCDVLCDSWQASVAARPGL